MSSRGLQPISVRHLPARLSPSSGRRSAGGMRHIWSFGWHGCGWSRGGRRSHTTRGASWVGGHWKRRATGHLLILDVDGRLAPNVCQPHHTTDRAEPTLPPRLVGLHHRTQPLVRPRALARQRISDVAGGRLRRRAIGGGHEGSIAWRLPRWKTTWYINWENGEIFRSGARKTSTYPAPVPWGGGGCA